MKTCLVQSAAASNTFYGLGNGMSGPVALSSAGTETVSSAQVQLDSGGRVLITKTGAFPDTVCKVGDTVMVSQGTAIQQGLYPIGGKIGSDSLVLGCHRSMCLPQRWRVDYTALPADGDTFTAGGVVYRFKTTTANPNDILRQANATATLTSLLRALGLTGTGQAAASGSPDYINTTVPNPLFKTGGAPIGAANTGYILLEQRMNDHPSIIAPTLTGTWGTVSFLGDVVQPPSLNQAAVNVVPSADCAVRLAAPGSDQWSGIGRVTQMKAVALAGTTPTLTLYAGRHIQAPSGTSGPVFGSHDPLVAAPALALPVSTPVEVDLGYALTRWGGLLFRVGGTNPVVLLSFD